MQEDVLVPWFRTKKVRESNYDLRGISTAHMDFGIICKYNIIVVDAFDFTDGHNTAFVAFYKFSMRQILQFMV